jgi:hypothetical protein
VDHHVYLARQLAESVFGHAEQRLPEVACHGNDTPLRLGPPEPVPAQVVVDGCRRVLARTHEAVDLRLRPLEQRVEEERAQKAGRTRQEDAAGVAQGGGGGVSLRHYLRVESRLGPQVRPRRAFAVAVALEGFDPVAQAPDRGVFEEGAHRDVHAESVLDPTGELRRGEGVAAQVEEVVVRAHLAPLETENVLPGSREQVLLLGARRVGREPADRLGRVGSPRDDTRRGLGQALAVHLA